MKNINELSFKELGDMWVKDNLKSERKKLKEAQASYDSLTTESDYKQSIGRLVEVRKKIVELWIDA